MPTATRRGLVCTTVAVLLTLLTGGPATADTAHRNDAPISSVLAAPEPPAGTSDGNGCNPTVADAQRIIGDSRLLSINRWGDQAGDLHDLYGSGTGGLEDVGAKTQNRFLFTAMLNLGNAMWQGSANLSGFASRFCVLDSIGTEVDSVAATIGDALFDGGLITLAVVAVVVTGLLGLSGRGGGRQAWRRVVRTGAILALMVIMLLGARASTPGNPGTGSPSWVLTKVSTVISTLASLPVQALSETTSFSDTVAPDGSGAKPVTDCSHFLQNMDTAYQATYGSQLNQLAASTPMAINAMWQESGLRVFIDQQYGQDNELGAKVFCRYLEWSAKSAVGKPGDTLTTDTVSTGKGSGTTIGLTFNGGGPAIPVDGSLPFYVGPAKTAADVQSVGWAACDWTGGAWKVNPAFTSVTGGPQGGYGDKQITPEMCQEWWETPPTKDDASSTAFWWDDDQEDYVASTTAAPEARNFIASFHGWNPSGGFALALAFLFTSLGILLIFGGLALAIIIAKVIVVLMILLVFVVLFTAMFGGTANDQLRRYSRQLLGMIVFTFAISVIYALIALTTGWLVKAGASLGRGSLVGVIWTGLAPLVAALILHIIFTRLLKMPSPFTPTGAIALSGAVGGIGGAAAAGLSRIGSSARRGASSVAQRGVGGLLAGSTTAAPSLARSKEPDMKMDPFNTATAKAAKDSAAATATAEPGALWKQRRADGKMRRFYRSGMANDSGAARIAAAKGKLDQVKAQKSAKEAMYADEPVTTRIRQSLAGAGKVAAAGAGVVAATATARAQRTAERAQDAGQRTISSTKKAVTDRAGQFADHPVRSTARAARLAGKVGFGLIGPGAPTVAAVAGYHLARRTIATAPQRQDRRAERRELNARQYREFIKFRAVQPPPQSGQGT